MKNYLYFLIAVVSVFAMALIFSLSVVFVMCDIIKNDVKPEYKIELLTFPNIKVESNGEVRQMEIYELEQFMLTNEL